MSADAIRNADRVRAIIAFADDAAGQLLNIAEAGNCLHTRARNGDPDGDANDFALDHATSILDTLRAIRSIRDEALDLLKSAPSAPSVEG